MIENKIIFDGDDTYYIPVVKPCLLTKAVSCVNEAAIDAETTLTFSDGTSTIGVITIANLAAEGTIDKLVLDATTKGKVELNEDTPLVVVVAGGSTNVEIALAAMFSDYHSY